MKGSAVRIRASASPICREYVGTGSARGARHLEHMPARANSMTGTVTGEAGLEVGSSEPSALVSATGETVYLFIAVAGGLSQRMGGREPDHQPAPRYPITAIEFSARTESGTRVRLPLRAGYVVRADWWPVLAIKPAALSVFLAAHAAEPRHISRGLPCKGARRARPRCRRVLGSRPRSEPFLRSTRRSPLRDRSYPAERRR